MLSMETFNILAHEVGFKEIGFCTPERFGHSEYLVESQEPLRERKQLRFSPEKDFPQAKSLAVLLWPYYPARMPQGDSEVFVDTYYAASNAAYHAALELESRVQANGCFAKANVAYPAKEAALRAGLGIVGQNSLLITPRYGTRTVIILMVTGIELPAEVDKYSENIKTCIACGRCAKACPSSAITNDGMIFPERCLRNFMMEGVVVPEHLRPKMGMKMIGCDICQRVCPMQPVSSTDPQKIYCLDEFMTDNEEIYSTAVKKLAVDIGRNAARPQRVRAQAALLAGNSKNKDYIPVLRQWAQMPFDAVREHALWAIRQIELETEAT